MVLVLAPYLLHVMPLILVTNMEQQQSAHLAAYNLVPYMYVISVCPNSHSTTSQIRLLSTQIMTRVGVNKGKPIDTNSIWSFV